MLPNLLSDQPSVRLATEADRSAIADLHYQSWQHSYAEHAPASVAASMTAAATEELWEQTPMADGTSQVHVATVGPMVVGFAAVDLTDPDIALIAALYISPFHQRVGHASRLVADIANQAQSAKCQQIASWVPTVDTARVVFFKETGMAPQQRRSLSTGVADEAPLMEVLLAAQL